MTLNMGHMDLKSMKYTSYGIWMGSEWDINSKPATIESTPESQL
jgi:hypothetical protein